MGNSDFFDYDSEDDDTERSVDEEMDNDTTKLDKDTFEEIFRGAFESKYLASAWQPKYMERSWCYWAVYEKHN